MLVEITCNLILIEEAGGLYHISNIVLSYDINLKLMVRHCYILTSDPAKHAIPKIAEVAYSVGQLSEKIA